jgi:hypothetical protein
MARAFEWTRLLALLSSPAAPIIGFDRNPCRSHVSGAYVSAIGPEAVSGRSSLGAKPLHATISRSAAF